MIFIKEIKEKSKNKIYLCMCPYCEREIKVRKTNFDKGQKSCGKCTSIHRAKPRKIYKKHGDSAKGSKYKRLYNIWCAMRKRCRNKNTKDYVNYGARGIGVSEEWQEYVVFKKWALEHGYRNELTLDRKKNDDGYNKDNCRWVNREVQTQNQRLLRATNATGYRGVTYNKEKGKYKASLRNKGNQYFLGYFKNKKKAALAYDNKVKDLKLESPLNFG